MAYQRVRIGAAAAAVMATGLLAGCNVGAGSMSCEQIASEAKQTSQGQQYKINSITNLREVSRNEAEARCQGNAAWSDNTTTDIYLRAYRDGENTMVAYSATGFENTGTQPAPGAAPPAQNQQ